MASYKNKRGVACVHVSVASTQDMSACQLKTLKRGNCHQLQGGEFPDPTRVIVEALLRAKSRLLGLYLGVTPGSECILLAICLGLLLAGLRKP